MELESSERCTCTRTPSISPIHTVAATSSDSNSNSKRLFHQCSSRSQLMHLQKQQRQKQKQKQEEFKQLLAFKLEDPEEEEVKVHSSPKSNAPPQKHQAHVLPLIPRSWSEELLSTKSENNRSGCRRLKSYLLGGIIVLYLLLNALDYESSYDHNWQWQQQRIRKGDNPLHCHYKSNKNEPNDWVIAASPTSIGYLDLIGSAHHLYCRNEGADKQNYTTEDLILTYQGAKYHPSNIFFTDHLNNNAPYILTARFLVGKTAWKSILLEGFNATTTVKAFIEDKTVSGQSSSVYSSSSSADSLQEVDIWIDPTLSQYYYMQYLQNEEAKKETTTTTTTKAATTTKNETNDFKDTSVEASSSQAPLPTIPAPKQSFMAVATILPTYSLLLSSQIQTWLDHYRNTLGIQHFYIVDTHGDCGSEMEFLSETQREGVIYIQTHIATEDHHNNNDNHAVEDDCQRKGTPLFRKHLGQAILRQAIQRAANVEWILQVELDEFLIPGYTQQQQQQQEQDTATVTAAVTTLPDYLKTVLLNTAAKKDIKETFPSTNATMKAAMAENKGFKDIDETNLISSKEEEEEEEEEEQHGVVAFKFPVAQICKNDDSHDAVYSISTNWTAMMAREEVTALPNRSSLIVKTDHSSSLPLLVGEGSGAVMEDIEDVWVAKFVKEASEDGTTACSTTTSAPTSRIEE